MPEAVDIVQETKDNLFPDERLKELVEAGVFYGRKRTKTHPRMRPYILLTRNDIEVINLNKTLEALESALEFLKEKSRGGGLILFVGTQPAAQKLKEVAVELSCPYVVTRWLGGTLTNFQIISRRIEYFKKLRGDFKSGAMEKYTKKEQLNFERELKRLEEVLGGLEGLTALPQAIVVVDPKPHLTAIREARRLKIPIVALLDTDSDPDIVNYPVPGNSKARSSINWFLEKVRGAVEEARRSAAAANEAKDGEPA